MLIRPHVSWGHLLSRRISASTLNRACPVISTAHVSTTAAGTSYEHLTTLTLQPLAFSLTHVGGRSDRGIDLLGHWSPPTSSSMQTPPSRPRIPVIVQCKAHVTTPKPAWVRELQGAMIAAPLHLGDGVVGVLVSKGRVTSGVREAVMKAERGVMWVQLEEIGERGRVGQMMWNKWITGMVGEGLGTGFVFSGSEGEGVERELRLLWEGRVWKGEQIGAEGAGGEI